MRLVVDSSAALRASMSSEARALIVGHELLAPPLMWSETCSAVHQAVWRHEIDDDEADAVLRALAELDIRRRHPARLHAEAYRLASELGWAKTYDAEFLALAHLEGARVLTTDARMRHGAQRTGLVIDPSDLPRSG